MPKPTTKNLLRFAAFSVLIGRAYQHLFWDAPFRSLLWDEQRIKPIVEQFFGYSWRDWVTNPAVDAGIQKFIFGMGIFYLLAATMVLFAERLPEKLLKITLWSASILLFFLALMYWKEKFFHLGQLFEYALQVTAPLFFLLSQNGGTAAIQSKQFIIKVAIALTFICHGLYAIGAYPRPGDFITMMMQGLWLNEDAALLLLNIAGSLDFIAAALLFAPEFAAHFTPRPQAPALSQRLYKAALWYCIIWGLLTALARVWAHFYLPFWTESLHQWAWQTIVRLPHFLIPLALWHSTE